MAIVVRSSNDILTEMVAKILAETQLTDLAPGSELSTLLEAAANSDYQCEVSALTLLQSSNLDNLVGKDLDAKALDLTLPDGVGGVGRIPAKKASGVVTISSAFNKVSALLYQGKPAPFIGANTIYIQDATNWPSSGGQLYIGRGTDHEEGPLTYTSINNTVNRPFYTILLDPTTPITKNHVVGESVILAQGGVRTIAAGTGVIAPSLNNVPSVQFTTNIAVTLLDGESSVSVGVTCSVFGTSGNVQANRITSFSSVPFTGATVTNPSSTASGQDTEDDNSLRQRIKDHPSTLSRGTARSIQSYLRGLSDPVSGRTITSTNIVQPTVIGKASTAYVDDGQGLEPSYAGQSFESLVNEANGNETLLRTAKSPIIPPLALGTISEPFYLTSGMSITFVLDDTVTETFTVNPSNYINVTSALASEIVNDFNSQNSRVRFRATANKSKVNAFDLTGDGETMVIQAGELQSILGLPTTTVRPLFLYKDNSLLNQKGVTATLNTLNFPWPNLTATALQGAQFEVDGVVQTLTITDADFGFATIANANITQWVNVLSKKIAGVKVTAVINSDNSSYIQFQTRFSSSSSGSLRVVSTGWVGNGMMWPTTATNIIRGRSPDYLLNRFSGQITLAKPPEIGSNITVGSQLTRASIYSKTASAGRFSLGVTPYGNPKVILGVDSSRFAIRDLSLIPSGSTFTVSEPIVNSYVLRLLFNNLLTITDINVDDFIYLSGDSSAPTPFQVPANAIGLYRVRRRGLNTLTTSRSFVGASFAMSSGSNLITVTTSTPHNLSSGVTVVVSNITLQPGGTIALGSLQGNRVITVTTDTKFTFLADTNSTATSTTNTLTAIAQPDSWIEVEASTAQRAALGSSTLAYGTKSLFAFQCQGTVPQVVDFGTSLTLTVDQVVNTINNSTVCLTAVKSSPKSLYVRTNNLSSLTPSTIAVLASVGSATSIFTPSVRESIQPHLGYSSSGYLWSGAPKLQSIGGFSLSNSYYQTRGYTSITKNKTVVVANSPNPTVSEDTSVVNYPSGCNLMPITGINYGVMSRVYNTSPTSPFTGLDRGENTYKLLAQTTGQSLLLNNRNDTIRMEEIPFGVNDKLVVVVDQKPTTQSSDIQLAKSASIMTISAVTGGAGNTIQLTLADNDDVTTVYPNGRPFFDTSSVFNTFDLKDLNILFRPTMVNYIYPSLAGSYTTLPSANPPAAIIIRSTQWGSAHRIRFAANYAVAPNTSGVTVSHRTVVNQSITSPDSGIVNLQLYVTLPTGTLVNGSTFTSSTYTITPSNFPWASSGPAIVQLVIASAGINVGNTYLPGNYLNIGGSTTYSGTYLIIAATPNNVTVVSPGITSSTYTPVTLDGSIYPVSSYSANPATVGDVIDAINNYSTDNPIATASFVTSNPTSFSLASKYFYPTFYTQGKNTPITTLSSIADSIDYHSIQSPYGCTLNIYAVNNPVNISCLNQYSDPPTLTSAQIANTGYSYLNEQVRILPATTKSISNWINLQAFTPLSSYSSVERCGQDGTIQFASKVLGGEGSIQVTGVKGNGLNAALLTNPEAKSPYIACRVPFADAESLVTGSLVKVVNSLPTFIHRAYRVAPTGTSITSSNDSSILNYFRPSTTVTYSYAGVGLGRFTFSSSPFISVTGDTITITKVDSFVAKITSSTNSINARVGDMLYLSPTSNANTANRCYAVTSDTVNQYLGYPVVFVANPQEIYVIGSNLVNDSFSYSALPQMVFIPMLKNEKNIRTNYNSSAAFQSKFNNSSKLYVRLKSLGNGVMFCSANTGSDADLQLAGLSVSSDDYVVFGSAFNLSNQGRFRLISHDGVNNFTFYNPKGSDQLVESTPQISVLDPGTYAYGDLMWGVGLSDTSSLDTDKRHIRVYDGDSVFEGDFLNISSPLSNSTSWFTNDLLGKWTITEIGVDANLNSYVKVGMQTPNINTQVVNLGVSAGSISFSERVPYQGFKYVVGSAINNQVSTHSDLILAPQTSFSKLSPSNGTYLSPLFKASFSKDINTGIDGYKTYSELMALAATVVDGSPTDIVSYPGVRAAGTAVDIQAPLEKSISLSVSLQATPGVGLSSIKDPVKSAISNYVKLLGVGESVVLSEIVKRVQQIPGVLSIVIDSTVPPASNGIISVAPIEVARITKDANISI
jgi:uncharacterized phage protein gp47/JayE